MRSLTAKHLNPFDVAVQRAQRSVRDLHARVLQAVQRRRTFAQIVRELEACTDRDLADLGIARADIRRFAREGAGLASR